MQPPVQKAQAPLKYRPVAPSSRPRHRSFTWVRAVFIGVPTWIVFSIRRLSWQKKLVIVLLLASMAATAGYYFLNRRAKEHQFKEVVLAWKAFDESALKLDSRGMRECLAKLEKLQPGNNLVATRQASLDRGEAEQNDPVMIEFWMNRHMADQQIEYAAREARKRIVDVKDHWRARCILAHLALVNRSESEALEHLKALPSPFTSRILVNPVYLNHALALFHEAKLDDGSLRMYRAMRLAPVLKSQTITKEDPRSMLQLLAIYLDSFADLDHYPDLLKLWASSSNVAQFLSDEPDLDIRNLIQLGGLQHRQLELLDQLIKRNKFSSSQARPYKEDLEERIDTIWKRVREKQPKIPEGYIGPALMEARNGRTEKCFEYLELGAQNCGDQEQMLAAQKNLLHLFNPDLALNKMAAAAARNPDNESIYRMVAETAYKSGRWDAALEACQRARRLAPNQVWSAVLEARLYLRQEKHAVALAILTQFKPLLTRHEELAELYVQALCLAKAKDDAFSFIDQLVAEAPSLAMTRGAMRSAYSAGFNEKTAEAANKILERFKSDYDPVFFMVLGNSYLNWAAPTVEVPTWNKERARKALFAFERVQKEDPDNLSVANNIAWIYLKALETPDAADRAAEPLRKAESENRLSDIHVGTLGIVQLAKGRYDSARGYLTRSVASAPSATRYVHLALAHYYLKNSDEARRNLRLANNLPCSPADTLELKKAQALLERK